MENWLLEGFTALIAGMSTVFAILILISITISLFKYIKPKNGSANHVQSPKDSMRNIEENHNLVNIQQNDMNQVVAAISIALAVSLNTTVDKLKVKSVRRL